MPKDDKPKFRDLPVFQVSPGKKRRGKKRYFGPPPRIINLMMQVNASNTKRLELFLKAKTAGALDNDDPEEVKEAEDMLKVYAAMEGKES